MTKLPIFHDSTVPQFPEETWSQRKTKPLNIEKGPESLGVMLQFKNVERGVLERFFKLTFY